MLSHTHTKFGDGHEYVFPVYVRAPVDVLNEKTETVFESWLATSSHSPCRYRFS